LQRNSLEISGKFVCVYMMHIMSTVCLSNLGYFPLLTCKSNIYVCASSENKYASST